MTCQNNKINIFISAQWTQGSLSKRRRFAIECFAKPFSLNITYVVESMNAISWTHSFRATNLLAGELPVICPVKIYFISKSLRDEVHELANCMIL